ncbi:hypothetical protein PUN28_002512 [Cardiocondyla obscurior]|uniref:Transposase n=1 Tax=Cardiocondyla obscurior TaxID=286306 RepID=A0AAW2GUN0_9HYME
MQWLEKYTKRGRVPAYSQRERALVKLTPSQTDHHPRSDGVKPRPTVNNEARSVRLSWRSLPSKRGRRDFRRVRRRKINLRLSSVP